MNSLEEIKKYVVTKEQCEATIKGVCEGCGGQLEALETVDNSGAPTFWVGCNHCSCFRGGIERKYWEIARKLIEENEIIPYSHMSKADYNDTPEKFEYWLDTQTAGLSRQVARIDYLLKN